MKKSELLLACVCLASLTLVFAAQDRILLKDVGALTLAKGQMTRARRSHPIPQLSCVGGSAQSSNYHPTVVQCQNRGFDGQDVQWECRGELDEAVKFGSISVNCEGYAYPDDPYVLQGSCGLEYSLDYTRQGEAQRYGDSYGHAAGHVYSSHYGSTTYAHDTEGSGWGTLIAFLILVGVIYLTLRLLCSPSEGFVAPAPSAAPGFGPGGYGSASAFPSAPPYVSTGYGAPSYAAPAGGAGFWSGVSLGGMLGYLFRPRPYYGPSHSYGMRPTFGGATFSAPRPAASFGSSRTSSGFGGTKRR